MILSKFAGGGEYMGCKNTIFALFAALFCGCLLALSINASPPSDEILMIADFDDSEDGFTGGSNADGVRIITANFGDEGTYAERTCLFVECAYRYPNIMRSTKISFDEPIDLTEYRSFEYDIYVPHYEHDDNALYYVRLNLVSEDGTSSYNLGTAAAGEWCSISADIGSFDGRRAIVEAEIALLVDTSVQNITHHGFYIDSVRAAEIVDREMVDRFLFDTFTVAGAKAEVERGKSAIVMTSEVSEPVLLQAAVVMSELPYPVNCLRVHLENNTGSSQMILHYTTFDSQAISEDKSVTVPIEPNSSGQYYYLPIGDASMLHSIELLFGDGKGEIKLISVSPVYRYEPEKTAFFGKITSCELGYGAESLCIVGEINRNAAISYRDSRIAVFKWNSDVLPEPDELALLTPVVEGEMTTRFELIANLAKNDPASRCSRYLAVILHGDGTYSLIDSPFCASNQSIGAFGVGTFEKGAKGMSCDDLSVVCDSDCKVTVLDFNIRSAFGAKSDSEPYIYGGCLYYPRSAYMESVDKKIRMLSDSGIKVVLRFTGLDTVCENELTSMYASDDYVLNQRVSELEDGVDYLGAIAEYTAGRWATGGSVVGVILGDGENRVAENGISIKEQALRTAGQLYSIYASYISKNSQAKVYVSVTDLYDTDPISKENEYVLFEYLPLLIYCAGKYGDFPWELCVEVTHGDRETADYADAADCEELLGLLDENGASGKNLIFCDDVYSMTGKRLSSLMQSYVLGYCSAYFNERVDAYIAEVSSHASAITDTVKYIDTELSNSIFSAVQLALKSGDLSDIISGFDFDKLPRKRISESEAVYDEPSGIKGRFPYFDFGSASGISDMWYGYYAKNISITNDGGTAMTVLFDSAAWGDVGYASWYGIIHRFGHTENMKLTPILKVNMKLDAVTPISVETVPVKLVLVGENERFESVGSVKTGEWTSVYFDIKSFGDIKNTETIQILVGDSKIYSAELSIRSVEGLSYDHNDDTLSEAIANERLKKLSPDEVKDSALYYWIVGGIVIAAATVVVVVFLSKGKADVDE